MRKPTSYLRKGILIVNKRVMRNKLLYHVYMVITAPVLIYRQTGK